MGKIYKIDNTDDTVVYITRKEGCVGLAFRENDVKIIIIKVDEKFRNKGFGSKILKYAIKYIKNKNESKKYINVVGDLCSTTEYIMYFYEKHGFNINKYTGEITKTI